MKKLQMKKLLCGSAFSGIGAVEQALKNISVNHENQFMIEIDKHARKTYYSNHKVNNIYSDITKVEPSTLDEIDLYTFGSPCQSFSIAGNRGGLNDWRGQLIFDGLNIIKEKQPKYFIYENVMGMLSQDNGRSFDLIKNTFFELNYKVYYKVLNSKDYNSPQNRKRLFIVGIRNDINQDFEFPEPTTNFNKRTVSDVIRECKIEKKDFHLFDTTHLKFQERIRKTDIHKVGEITTISYGQDKRVVSSDGISPCLVCGGAGKFYDEVNDVYRFMNQKELSLIQSFDIDFIYPIAKTHAIKQIGNSINVKVLEAILKNLLDESYFK